LRSRPFSACSLRVEPDSRGVQALTEALTWMAGSPGKAVMTIGVVIAFGLAAWLIQTLMEK